MRVIVPFSAGGSGDGAARPYAERLSKALGQQFVVENRAGASGAIGIETAAKAAPDGYTVLFSAGSPVVILPKLRKVPYDPDRDLIPVAVLGEAFFGLAVHPSVPANTLQELLALAKRKPGQISHGSAGLGTTPHLWVEALRARAGIDFLHVPYKGISDAMQDALGGHVDSLMDSIVFTHAKAGTLRLLFVMGETRHPDFPDVPTQTEAGLPGYDLPIFFGAYFPKGTPAEIVTKLNAELVKIAREPEFQKEMLLRGLLLRTYSPPEMVAYMERTSGFFAKLVADTGVKLD